MLEVAGESACKEPRRLHNEFPHIRVSCTLINDLCSTFLTLNLLLSLGHPGFDNFSGALLHVKTWAVKTLPKVTFMTSPVRRKCFFFNICMHLSFCCTHLSASENYGKSFQDVTSLINNTFIRSEFGIAIGPENSGKVSHVLNKFSGCNFTTFA